ncbi:uncharacterized protein LOC121800795 [Salvia splendens]|uniref:uncharacterized protein LOC121800795 n=1 Tax=Salvia splendens TaxID=180675 RepID=UPI001C26755B|nr:uncharacterized protein LOC121800795 [Salvia splendens]
MDSDDERYQEAVDLEFQNLVAAVQQEAEEAEAVAAVAVPRPFYHRRYIDRDHAGADRRLMEDYFSENARYPPEIFRRRFRMSQQLFVHIATCLAQQFKCFNLRYDADPACRHIRSVRWQLGSLPMPGPLACLTNTYRWAKRLSYRRRDSFVGALRISSKEYLRKPTADDCQSLIDMHVTVIGNETEFIAYSPEPLFIVA